MQWASGEGLPSPSHTLLIPWIFSTCQMQWASGEGLSEVGPMGASTLQFPLLRTTADLLMMPKELLMEPAIRRDVAQALSRWGYTAAYPRYKHISPL